MTWRRDPTHPRVGGGATPVACTTAPCPLSRAMTPEVAQSLMDQFKKTAIPFDYPPDCCYARARVMCDLMEQQGYASEKIWSEGNLTATHADGSQVTFPDRNGDPQVVQWHYHVAPIVNVRQPDGSVERRVLDPSLADEPLTVDEWKARCGVAPSATRDRITPAHEHYPFHGATAGTDYPVSEAEQALQQHRDNRDRNRAAAKKNP